MVSSGEAGALISAGSTGAAMACAAFLIGRLKGVSRPAIATFFPSGQCVMDMGANLEVKPEHLLEFAVMGSVYSSIKFESSTKSRILIGLLFFITVITPF